MTPTEWDQIAPYWELFENDGMTPKWFDGLTLNKSEIVLVVGAGQGLLVEALDRRGYQAIGIDSSSEMVRFAQERRGIELVLADGLNLPFDQDRFSTVIISSGVMQGMRDQLRRQLLTEARRVTRPNGTLIAAATVIPSSLLSLQRSIGLMEGDRECHIRFIELWNAPRTIKAWTRVCEKWLPNTSSQLAQLLTKRFRGIGSLIGSVQHFANKLDRHRIDIHRFFREFSVFDQYVETSSSRLNARMKHLGLRPLRHLHFGQRTRLIECQVL